MQKNPIIFSLVVIALVGVMGYLLMTRHTAEDSAPNIPSDTGGTACTQEAKVCPDGSFVGRMGPSCEFVPCPSGQVNAPPTNPPPKSAETLCKEDGGSWQKAGALGTYRCIHAYADGGKPCGSSSQCAGGCVVTKQNPTAGFCKQDDNPFGCYQSIEDKNAGRPIMCTD